MPTNKKLTGLLAGLVCYGLSASVAQAIMIEEQGDAGELLGTAQDATAGGLPVTSIIGTLINLGTAQEPKDDVDMYKIDVTNPGAFSVTVRAESSGDNDLDLYLFDAAGVQVLYSDNDGIDPLPQFNVGDLSGSPVGMYFLAIDLFLTTPLDVSVAPPDVGDGWFRDPIPAFQISGYELTLTGTGAAPVPEPGMLALFGLGLVGMGLVRMRMKA